MADWDLSELTDAELSTLRTNALAKMNALLTGVQGGSLDGATFQDLSLGDVKGLMAAVMAEQRQRSDTTGDLIAIDFQEASD